MPSELATTLAASEEDRLLQAEALVRAHCGWHVAPVRLDTMSLGLSSDATVVLPTQRIVEVVSVSDGLVGLDPDAYTWREQGILDLRPTFSVRAWGDLYDARSYTWFQNLTVRLRHGYDEAPPEVTAVVQAVAQRVVNNPKGFTLYLPTGDPITRKDRVRVRGDVYPVRGAPARWADKGVVVQVFSEEG
jgi:hypothetical protein